MCRTIFTPATSSAHREHIVKLVAGVRKITQLPALVSPGKVPRPRRSTQSCARVASTRYTIELHTTILVSPVSAYVVITALVDLAGFVWKETPAVMRSWSATIPTPPLRRILRLLATAPGISVFTALVARVVSELG
jgi:hypothetical protein